MSIILDANRETQSLRTQTKQRVRMQEPFLNRLLSMNPSFMKPSYHPIQIEPKLVILFKERRKASTKLLNVSIDITTSLYHLHEFLPIRSKLHRYLET
ncbi:hypothetical protein MtrunA17_Chr1g0187461 [Medicago truncatula]|uniref:Uncharacterized protein n=1 Tax=Medicago truncatula TaxID=3880 RepID=A0A396JQ17_MEDTR|nr:hypothetical protein MtrunA17_Chr1g0187461 [Medicago truncatula]